MMNKPVSAAVAAIRNAGLGADDQVIARACALLNSIVFTVDQFERGIAIYDKACAAGSDGEAALQDFCQNEGLLPSDIAAEALLIRSHPIDEARYHGEDLKKHNRELYEECITRPIHRGYFRLLQPDEVDADGNLLPLLEAVD